MCAQLDEHHDGTLAQMAEDLKWRYPAHPDEVAVILRGMMAAELRRRTRPGIVSIRGEEAPLRYLSHYPAGIFCNFQRLHL